MKTTKNTSFTKKVGFYVSILMIALCLFLPNLTTQNTNAADSPFSSLTRTDENFSLEMSAISRTNGAVPYHMQTAKNSLGDDVTYICFKWRDLQCLDFCITISPNRDENAEYSSYAFQSTYVRTEYLENAPSFGLSTPKNLYAGDFSSNPFSRLDLHFYEDSDSKNLLDQYSFLGNDFGIYKFNFVYSYTLNGEASSRTLGEIVVAILPDDIDEIPAGDVPTITYVRSSSDALLNAFTCSLSTTAFDYVNPDHIQWLAYGVDIYNNRYCMTQEMVENEPDFINYLPIWQTYYDTHGNIFILDTNNIEGTWNVKCIVRNSDGSEKYLLPIVVEGLSTIKVQPPDLTWLILLVIFISVAVLVLISFLIIYIMKKHEKVW